MRAKFLAIALAAILIGYVLLLGQSAVALLGSGEPLGMALGAVLMFFPALGVYIVWREIRFGTTAERMTTAYREANGGESVELVMASIPATSQEAMARVEEDPDGWQQWFAAGVHYAQQGDKKQARRSMYHAAHLYRGTARTR
ncbi:MAG: hypothetical protein KDC39_00590 [Actinobacteria bacterium]|nr:hypothetical protein [Actinomycetota bacterium]